jgi:hypothetical protein
MGREVYILQATMDTRPEDLLVTPVIEGEGRLCLRGFVASDRDAPRRHRHAVPKYYRSY